VDVCLEDVGDVHAIGPRGGQVLIDTAQRIDECRNDSRFQLNGWRSTGVWPRVPTSRAPTATGTPRTRPRTRSARSGALPFFQHSPALHHPLVDGFVVARGRSPRRSLPAPLQILAQEGPHVRRVIAHACESLDHLCHALQGPHVIRIAIGFGAFEQLAFNVSKLVSAQLRQPPGTTCATQSVSPRPTPRGTPVGDDLMRDTNLACDLAIPGSCRRRLGGSSFRHTGRRSM
jgi:hypothetical protein